MKKTPRTIALVANTSWNLVHFRFSLAEQLQDSGYRVLAIAPPGAYAERLRTYPFSRYHAWSKLRAHGQNVLQEWAAARELRQLYRILRPDLTLHFTIKPNLYGTWASSRLGIPSISTITGLGYPFLHPGGGNRLVPFLYREALKGTTATVFQNEDDRSLFLKTGLVAPAKTRLIPGSGVDTRFFHPLSENHREGTFTFLYAGRLLRDKGILEYLKAACQIAESRPGLRFWIAGEMEPENPAALTRRELDPYFSHPAFKYWGFLEDIRPVMAQADVFVLPSYREGMPRAVLEAMAMGKPIVTTDAPGCKETVEPGENGLLVPVRDEEALTLAMRQLMELSPAVLRDMGEKSRQRALDRFNMQAINQQFLDLIKEVLADGIPAKKRSVVF
ncbi:MAG: glycosyltransferase family 4 protein [Lewinellaceae bacterium]|nr:glycosyltransferase family 4 protein [Lewinellaceae bacterium]